MGPVQSIKTCLRKSVSFTGRASRSEFWWFAPFWLLGVVTLHASIIENPNTKNQIFGSFFLLFALSVPAISAAARRAIDAGFDVIWIGWGFGLILFGNGLIDLEKSAANVANLTWLTPVGLAAAAISTMVLIFILLRPSKNSINQNEAHS